MKFSPQKSAEVYQLARQHPVSPGRSIKSTLFIAGDGGNRYESRKSSRKDTGSAGKHDHDPRRNCRPDHPRDVRTHRVHQQKVVRIGFETYVVGHPRRHGYC